VLPDGCARLARCPGAPASRLPQPGARGLRVSAPAVLVIAGSDSSGGAGLARDLEVLAHFGVRPLCVVTAVTAQSDTRMVAVHTVPPEIVRAQITAALATCPIAAIKIGMLGTSATVEAVASGLPCSGTPVVLDPVLVSSSGGVLLDEGGRRSLTNRLLAHVRLLTPNILEAAALLAEPIAASPEALIE
jgi:hydroxymethylpyrimidine/phosphomethylpyrimidine kinase